jgi:gentisate 1,2-dioxygenase
MTEYGQAEQRDAKIESLHDDLARSRFVPGWHRPGNPPLWNGPRTPFEPVAWSYRAARAALDRAGELIGMEFAERRNLIMTNPAAGNRYPTVRTQVLAYQMLRPGERARTHRHSPHAGRLVIDTDEGAYTVVDGVKLTLRPGDVLLTPGWHWHGHAHAGEQPAYWLDFLDAPLVQLLDPMFFEAYPGDWQEPTAATRTSPFLFTWEDSVRLLDATAPSPSGYFGRRIELGSPALPTIGLHMHRLTPGVSTRPLRTTANYQYCVVEGEGTSTIDGTQVAWSRGDVVVAPCWSERTHRSADGATLLEITDEPLQRYCGYLRTSADIERGDGAHLPLDQLPKD